MLTEKNFKKIVEEKFDIKVNKIEKNLQSTVGNVYIVFSNKSKYVIKAYNNLKHTKWIVKLHKVLVKNNFYVPEVIKNNLNKEYLEISKNTYIVVYSFLKGHQVVWDETKIKLTDNEICILANTLRDLHKITNNSEINLPSIPFENYIGRKSILHFDLTRQNIFINDKEKKVGFIDFDDAKFGEAVCDVAILIANLFFSKTKGVNLDGINKFIDAYYLKDFKLKKEETPFIKKQAIMWIDYTLKNNDFNTSITESFNTKRKLIEEYL